MQIDAVLVPLLETTSSEQRQRVIAEILIRHADPVLHRVLSSKLTRSRVARSDVKDDLHAEAMARLFERLSQISASSETAIASFPDYVAVVGLHVFDDFMRTMYPIRARLKNRIRYALRHDARFAVWPAVDGTLLTGHADWKAARNAVDVAAVNVIPDEPLHSLLARLFAASKGPIELDALVDRVGELRGERDGAPAQAEPLVDPEPALLDRTDSVRFLQRFWIEVRSLPSRQVLALLLSLRDSDGESLTRLLPGMGVASPEGIRHALGLEAVAFDELWEELPIPDARIAQMLGITTQQVVHLRKAARARLARRLANDI